MSYKSSNFRRGQTSVSTPSEKTDPKVQQLQELFPSWSEDDLKSILSEVNGDLEQAVFRISEGHAEQWGSVTRKKEKRTTSVAAAARDANAGRERERGESRGARGGRGGGRGGRGGARGTGRGGHREPNGRHTTTDAATPSAWGQDGGASTATATADTASATESVGNGAVTGVAWGDADKGSEQADSHTIVSTSAWGESGDASAPFTKENAVSTPTWGSDSVKASPSAHANGVAAAPTEVKSQVSTPTPSATSASKAVSKTPFTSGKSWAQIARPQEKLKPAPTPSPAPPAPAVEPAPLLATAAAELELISQSEAQEREEPTTAQAPTWDDEPQAQPQATLPVTADGWITSSAELAAPEPEPPKTEAPAKAEPAPASFSSPSGFPAQLNSPQKAPASPVVAPAKPATPVSYSRPAGAHRTSSRFKTTDQAVVMPSTFGTSIEKLGMQFGSVGLGGDDFSENSPSESVAEAPSRQVEAAVPPSAPEPLHPQASKAPAAAEQVSPSAPPSLPTPQPSIPTVAQIFQSLPQQTQQQVHTLQGAQQTPPSLLPTQTSTQSSLSSQAVSSTASSTPLTAFSTQQTTPSSQPSLSPYQQHSSSQQLQHPNQTAQVQAPAQSQPQPQSQTQSQLHQQFPHFPSHLDPALTAQSPPQSAQQSAVQQGLGSHGSYFRQPEQNYFHTPTPPAGQVQDVQYGSFGHLSQQLGHQNQGSHLSGFGTDQFGYNDAPRGFYESYGQQSGFGGRNTLSHEDLGKSLAGTQQSSQSSTGGLSQNTSQGTQQQSSQQPQSGNQPQAPASGQPQQGYAPVPYYYNPYHQPSQFYGPPYGSGYGLGQYAAGRYQPQQPPMFQPPNVAPTSASPANAKGPSNVPGLQAGLQPQSNPYAAAQGLYTQQHSSSGYDDGYGHQHQLGHQHQHSQGVASLPTNEYSKQLYGGQGIQSFMGMSQSTSQSTAAPLSQRGGSGTGASSSPENTYKSYGPGMGVGASGKDVGGPGVGSSITGGQGTLSGQSSRGGIQQPQHQHSQGFYGANRFSTNQNAGGPPNQQTQQQQPGQSYGTPQGGTDNSFYYQRGPSQQQPYWQ